MCPWDGACTGFLLFGISPRNKLLKENNQNDQNKDKDKKGKKGGRKKGVNEVDAEENTPTSTTDAP